MPCALANNFGHWETIAGHDPDVPFRKVTILPSSCARNRHRDATGVMQSGERPRDLDPHHGGVTSKHATAARGHAANRLSERRPDGMTARLGLSARGLLDVNPCPRGQASLDRLSRTLQYCVRAAFVLLRHSPLFRNPPLFNQNAAPGLAKMAFPVLKVTDSAIKSHARGSIRVSYLAATLVCLVALLLPALWNGYPLLQFDTGGYLARWYEGYLVPSRSTVFALFLHFGEGLHFGPNSCYRRGAQSTSFGSSSGSLDRAVRHGP